MEFSPAKLSAFHNEVLQNTELGQLCAQNQLFRDRYQVLRMLGRGGFGITFLAKDTFLPGQPLCVIKQLCPRVTDTRVLNTARRRFYKEAKTLSFLGNHSQIPLLLDYFVIGQEFYLVQEYIEGITLARLVRRSGAQSEAKVKEILREILNVLDYIHRQGVIHRDLKPQNLILAQEDNRIVLIDFGAVKERIATITDSTTKCSTSHFIGTMGFAPPEQFALRPVYATDIYALGVTCIYLLTGKAPLDIPTNPYTGQMEWQGLVQLTPDFARIVQRMVEPALSDRYKSASVILQALEWTAPETRISKYVDVHALIPDDDLDSQPDEITDIYLPPHIKTAREIRGWKERFEQRRPKYTPQ